MLIAIFKMVIKEDSLTIMIKFGLWDKRLQKQLNAASLIISNKKSKR